MVGAARAEHIRHKKRIAKQTGFGHRVWIAGVKKRCANVGFDGGQNLPVDVVKKIDGQQQKQCAARTRHSSRIHWQL
jgi:hypothetical protein